ncbi:MAG: hypothetical protein WBJ10_15045, partial [Daejeonella sp.]|uniref:hypothetical protein n=1 Tax=Daejeonella sp. TaxID=2805397 RepID=UPI003C751829
RPYIIRYDINRFNRSNRTMNRLKYFSHRLLQACVTLAFLCTSSAAEAQIPANTSKSLVNRNLWTAKELMQPAELASILKSTKSKKPVILNIGVVENISGAKKLGAAEENDNLQKLNKTLKGLPKNSLVIIYCGCCPFDKCPNIRPAFKMMKEMGFLNGKLLNLPVNLKQDWINKGYPMAFNN